MPDRANPAIESSAQRTVRRLLGYVRAGWIELFGADPPEGALLKAWAFDAERGRAYRIAGEATVRR